VNVPPNLKSVALPIPEIIAGTLKLGQSLDRMFKVIDSGANLKRLCDFLLVRHSNLDPILHRFGDITGFLCS